MQTISKTSLDSVIGGKGSSSIPGGSPTATTTPLSTGTGTGTGSCGGGLSGALASLNNTLKSLNKNNGSEQTQEMMMLGLCMAFSRPAQSNVVVYGGGGGGWGWHHCW